ncbi:hypothetical protein [Variovorax atrisoli]|uniref:hypothetical protein n=1 Tax=Variovorax atrisoli TaxID=3394203 RepID=UPI0013E0598A|nr:hypothetical protein [Variovorax sp. 369]
MTAADILESINDRLLIMNMMYLLKLLAHPTPHIAQSVLAQATKGRQITIF